MHRLGLPAEPAPMRRHLRAGGDLDYIDGAITGLHYNTGAAPP
jgi:hypothetical protein